MKEADVYRAALDRAAYALFQLKRFARMPQAAIDFVRLEHEKACEVLNEEVVSIQASSVAEARRAVIEECADIADQKLDHFSGTECIYICDVAEAIRDLARVSPQLTINQCDGCRRGLPIIDGKHYLEGIGTYRGEVMGCTKDRYGS